MLRLTDDEQKLWDAAATEGAKQGLPSPADAANALILARRVAPWALEDMRCAWRQDRDRAERANVNALETQSKSST